MKTAADEGRPKAPFYFRFPHWIILAVLSFVLLGPYPLYAGILVISVLVVCTSVLRKQCFARITEDFTPEYNEVCHEDKVEHFKSLAGVESSDEGLKKMGKFRLLDLGCGAGANLMYYPDNAVVIAVDYNPSMETFFRLKRLEMEPQLERFLVTSALDLKDIESGSVDVVSTCMLLNYLEDYDLFFAEVLRVLAPGGKYYFWEHVLDPNPRSLLRASQWFLEPIVTRCADGAHLIKKTAIEFESRRHLFQDLSLRHFYIYPHAHMSAATKFFVWFLQSANICGVASKNMR
ncbi:unnamed protein product [Notodromas monacha]|uniref:Methyltransferase type 11 domain-containing protein n=1 Tax=Notodromas monacha TaxID=399045 RepID=A0A7R9G8E7_9CRUS|nr:unnamed protein product [Notodromas monacha]CAG0913075.1 unnamed protein product [Notodromas monacha]